MARDCSAKKQGQGPLESNENGIGDEMSEGRKVDPMLRIGSILLTLIAAGVLIGAIGRQSYSYYQIMRWLAAGAAALLIWRGVVQGVKWAWAMVAVAVLFNPIAPIHLSRDTWQVLDVASAVVLIAAIVALEWLSRSPKKGAAKDD